MIELFNWLALIVFAIGSVYVSRWVVRQSFASWKGPDTMLSFAFLYAMTLATVAGFSLAVASLLYFEILYQPAFMQFAGLTGAIKILLMFTGLWYAALYALKLRGEKTGGPKS